MTLPQSWSDDEWVEVEMNGSTVRLRGVTFKQYQNALDDAVRGGKVGTRDFCRLLEEDYDAETEVVDGAA